MCRKHTRLEGLIVEFETEQTLMKGFIKNKWRIIDALVLRGIVKGERNSHFIILPRNKSRETLDDIIALGSELKKTKQQVRSLKVTEKGVYLRNIEGEEDIELIPDPQNNKSMTEDNRVLAMFWGFAIHTPKKFCEFARDILLKDCFIQPYFNAGLWDLDKFLISPGRSRIIYIETKHKYPFKRKNGDLNFGMNKGEVETLNLLKKTDISCWHTILLKPQWEKDISSTYLFYNREARKKTLWLAADMKSDDFIVNSQKKPFIASKETSINNSSSLKYFELNSSSFYVVGKNSLTSEELSENFYNIICNPAGKYQKVTKQCLLDNRISK